MPAFRRRNKRYQTSIRGMAMAPSARIARLMTIGEGGAMFAFIILAMLSIVVAAKAYTPEYAFHAYLFAAASVGAALAITNRYFKRSRELPPPTVDGTPN